MARPCQWVEQHEEDTHDDTIMRVKKKKLFSEAVDDVPLVRGHSRAGHSSTFRLNVTHYVWDTLCGVCESVTKTALVELKSGRVASP